MTTDEIRRELERLTANIARLQEEIKWRQVVLAMRAHSRRLAESVK